MDAVLEKIKDLSTVYLYTIIFGTGIYSIFVDCKSLNKKKLFRDEKICKFIGYGHITIGVALFIITNYII